MNCLDSSRRSGFFLGAFLFLTSISFLLLHSTAFAQPYVYERSFGTAGEGPGQFGQITAIDQDSQGNYIVLDGYAGEFQVCSDVGVCTEHDTLAKAANEHGNQWGLAVNSMDEIFITNQFGNVEKCTRDGECTIFLTEHADLGISPWGIAIDQQDRVYISDTNYGRIIVCSATGSCSSFGTWGEGLGEFTNPYGLAINSKGQVVILDGYNTRIQACDHTGNCEYTTYSNRDNYYYGGYGQGVALLPSDTMITTGYGYSHVNACTPGGPCRIVVQYDYNNANYLQSPAGVMVDGDRLVIGDYGAVHILAPNITINPGINDAWVEAAPPGQPLPLPGQGLLVSVFEHIPMVFIAWFTYETERPTGLPPAEIGEWGHRWITMQGGYSGNVANLTMYLTAGGVFENGSLPPTTESIGTATLTVHDCYRATLVYSTYDNRFQGSKNLARIVSDNVPNCEIMTGNY